MDLFIQRIILLLLCGLFHLELYATSKLKGVPNSAQELIQFNRHHECATGEFPCSHASKCLAQRYWCDEIKDCPEGDDEDVRYCGEKTSGFGRHFMFRIVGPDIANCRPPEPLLPPGTAHVDHLGKDGIKCFVERYPKRCTCMVNRVKCDNLLLSQVFTFTEETADPATPTLDFRQNRIQTINADVFRLFPNIQHLDFRQNSISVLNNRAFNGLVNMRHLHLEQNKLSRIDPKVFWPLESLCFLWLNRNSIQNWDARVFNNSKLRWLDVNTNRISLEPGMFENLTSLYYLDLEKNEIKHLSKAKLSGLKSLLYLDIGSNSIETIEEDTFEATPQLEELSLSNNSLTSLPEMTFAPLHNLQFLNLSHNPGIKSLPMGIFKGLRHLDRLNLSGVYISNIHREMFDDVPNNALVIFSKFHYCYYAAHIVDCYPKSDGISSSENLIELAQPRTIIWVLIALIPLSNLFVLIARCCIHSYEPVLATDIFHQRYHRHELQVISKFRYNLFIAHSLMTVYLLIIAIYDIQFRENYHREAYEWLNGFACQVAGMTASLSMFVSLVTLCAITVDRYITITQSEMYHLTGRGTTFIIIGMWLAGLMLFGIPVAVWDNVTGSFYGNNGLCLPLYLDEPYLNGWWYSSLLFFGNFILCLGTMTYCGVRVKVFVATNKEKLSDDYTADLDLARRYSFVIIVNLVCWLPVIVIKILAFTSFDIGNHIHSVFAILILPLNSFLTPVLHVYLSRDFRRKFSKSVSLTMNHRSNFFRRRSVSSDPDVKRDPLLHNAAEGNAMVPVNRHHHVSRNHSPASHVPFVHRRTPSPDVERVFSKHLIVPENRPRSSL